MYSLTEWYRKIFQIHIRFSFLFGPLLSCASVCDASVLKIKYLRADILALFALTANISPKLVTANISGLQ